jgi:hypothetical protein
LQWLKPVDVTGRQLDAVAVSGKFPGKCHGNIRTGSEDENVWHNENE